MPCDSIVSIPLVLDPARIEVLDEALSAIGFARLGTTTERAWSRAGVRVSLNGSSLEIQAPAPESVRIDILRATSHQIVERGAQRTGWALTWLGDGKAELRRVTYSSSRK